MPPKNISLEVAQHPDYKAEIAEIIRSNLTPKLLKEQLLVYHENDIAAVFDLLKREERYKLYSTLDAETLAGILEYTDDPVRYIGELSLKKRVAVLSQIEVSVSSGYFEQLEKAERDALLDLMQEDVRKEILLFASFHENEIGSKMTTNYISIHADYTVRQAMRALVEQAAENDNISTLYVVDEDEVFVGAIDLKDLIIAREYTELKSIIKTSYPYVYANELIDECIERIKDYSEDSIPVLDTENKLRGVLTAQDITGIVEESLGEDYAKIAGLSAEEDLNEPLKKSIGKRLPWLLILFFLGLVVSSVVGLFEKVVASLTQIVAFQSLILGMAGNAGTQSLAITIRVLMDEHMTGRQKLSLIAKEARVGFCNGGILAVFSFVFIGLYLFLLKGEPVKLAFSVSLCTGVALLAAMFLSSITGTAIPVLFKKLNIDPAVASGPLITTLNDLVGVVTYYGFAWILLINILHL